MIRAESEELRRSATTRMAIRRERSDVLGSPACRWAALDDALVIEERPAGSDHRIRTDGGITYPRLNRPDRPVNELCPEADAVTSQVIDVGGQRGDYDPRFVRNSLRALPAADGGQAEKDDRDSVRRTLQSSS